MKYFDAHAHVNFAAYKDDYREVIGRALASGIGLINVGTQIDTSRRAIEIAHEFEEELIFAAVGLHPIHTEKSYHDSDELGGDKGFSSRGEVFDREAYRALASDPKVVAVGECGLDYYRLTTYNLQLKTGDTRTEELRLEEELKNKQREAFLAQIELSCEVKKPLMIHCRNAYADVISILKSERAKLNDPPGIIHFFAGSKEEAQEFLDLGFYFTFGGVITFVGDYDEAVRYVPMDRILTETDAPYVTPVPHRGKRNEPAFVVEVAKKISEIKEIPLEELSDLVLENTQRVFGVVL